MNSITKKKRDMSPNVTTRWYRSPEVILVDPNYNQSTDMWGLGCILFELLSVSEKYSNKQKFDNK